MADARSKSEWGRTSAILALLANVTRDPKKSVPFTPSDFNPHERQNQVKPVTKLTDLSILKAVFVDQRIGEQNG